MKDPAPNMNKKNLEHIPNVIGFLYIFSNSSLLLLILSSLSSEKLESELSEFSTLIFLIYFLLIFKNNK